MKTKELLNISITAALEAGKAILEIYNSEVFDIELKEDNSPLTRADRISHKIISSFLIKTKIPILSEEGRTISFQERKNWNRLWIIDPIDGTKEFIKRNNEFTVNIALIKDQKPILGVIYVPVTRILYFSSNELGAFKIKLDSDLCSVDTLIKRSSKLPFKRGNNTYTIVASKSHMSERTKEYIHEIQESYEDINIISVGSSLKLCMVAEGTADCYPRFAPTMEWDTAAGQAICENSDCRVIDYDTMEPMKYNKEELLNNWFIVKK